MGKRHALFCNTREHSEPLRIQPPNYLVDVTQNCHPVTSLFRLCRRVLTSVLGRSIYYRLWFWRRHGYWPNLRDPRRYNEKLLWLSLHSDLESLAPFVDKCSVRNYVAECAGEQVLVRLLAAYRKPDDILPFSQLPARFVMKAAHGSHMTLLVRDKRQLQESVYYSLCERWLTTSYYWLTGERVYRRCTPGIVLEELLDPDEGALYDFKFLCYNGEPEFIDLHGNRFTDHREAYFSIDWDQLPIRESVPGFQEQIGRPRGFSDLVATARILSRKFTFVRVDLYAIDGRVKFGELTFIPANGRSPIRPREYEYILGRNLPLSRQIWRGDSPECWDSWL